MECPILVKYYPVRFVPVIVQVDFLISIINGTFYLYHNISIVTYNRKDIAHNMNVRSSIMSLM